MIDLSGREHDQAVLRLLAAAQIHRDPADAGQRAPLIADQYAGSASHMLWGYELEGLVAGLVGVELLTAESAIICDLAVLPENRRRGIGRMLLDHLRMKAGLSSLEGDTLAVAVPFYEGCGFTVVETDAVVNGEALHRFSWRRF